MRQLVDGQGRPELEEVRAKLLSAGGAPRLVLDCARWVVLRFGARQGAATWCQVIEWCIERRCKILRHDARYRMTADMVGEAREAQKCRKGAPAELVACLRERARELFGDQKFSWDDTPEPQYGTWD